MIAKIWLNDGRSLGLVAQQLSMRLATAGASTAGGGAADGATAGSHSNATHIAVYLAFPERLPKPLLEMALADTQLMMRKVRTRRGSVSTGGWTRPWGWDRVPCRVRGYGRERVCEYDRGVQMAM